MSTEEKIRKKIHALVKTLFTQKQKNKKFIPGKSLISIGEKVYDEQELINGADAVLDGWWTEGRFAKEFEDKFSKLIGKKYVSLTNSGSSANLIAVSALTSATLEERALKPGDEVITAAMGFPTTVNPIILQQAVPVFVDVKLETGNVDMFQVEKAISKKTKAIVLAHTLGNPFPVKEVAAIAKKYNLWVIEDCCDALGSTYQKKQVGSFGDMATFSFYAAHHITMGQGGAVITNNALLHAAIRQFSNWGSECLCDPGKHNYCKNVIKRPKFKTLPKEYYHRYIYSQIGFNTRLTDMQAALGVPQIKKLGKFTKKRQDNFNALYAFFKQYETYFILSTWEKEASPSWFGFMLILRDNSPFTRYDIVGFLESKKISTRSPLGGNLLRHPAYENIKHRVIGDLKNSNKMMNDGFWIGVHPGIGKEQLQYIMQVFHEFFKTFDRKR